MLELLKNEIIVNWVAPIITGLILAGITSFIIKTFKNKKDDRIVKDANQRYVDTILPFVIQKIECPNTYISDVRSVIIQESRLKEKYVYSEIELRNKLIMDISESKYIDEENKKDLIEFTYKIFKNYEKTTENKTTEEYPQKKKTGIVVSTLITLVIVAEVMIVIINALDRGTIRPEENILYIIPLLSGIICLILGLIIFIFSPSESKTINSKKDNFESIYYNYINQKIRNDIIHNSYKKNKEKDNQKK